MSLIDNAIFQREKRRLGNACGGEMWRCQQQDEGVPPPAAQRRCLPITQAARASRRRLAASAGGARRPPLRAGERGRPRSVTRGRQGGWAQAVEKAVPAPQAPPSRPSRAGTRPPSWPCPAARAGGLPAPDRAGPPRGWAPPGPPWQGLCQAGSVGRWADPRRGHQRAQGGRGWADGAAGLREKWLYFSYTLYYRRRPFWQPIASGSQSILSFIFT